MAAPDWERGLKRLRAKPGSENVWVPQHEAVALAAEFDRRAGDYPYELVADQNGTIYDQRRKIEALEAALADAEARFDQMKQRVEASHSTPAYRRHHETWQEAADRIMRERDGETLRATAALARLSEGEQAFRRIADPKYVVDYPPWQVVEIYREWARAALTLEATEQTP